MTLDELEQRRKQLLEELKNVKDPDRELELTAQIEVINTLIKNKRKMQEETSAPAEAPRKDDKSIFDLGDIDIDPNEQLLS